MEPYDKRVPTVESALRRFSSLSLEKERKKKKKPLMPIRTRRMNEGMQLGRCELALSYEIGQGECGIDRTIESEASFGRDMHLSGTCSRSRGVLRIV
jgi:hypothetical protein